jgi:hypothetical protein
MCPEETTTAPFAATKPQNGRRAAHIETGLGIGATVLSAILLLLTALNAGPLWRDETNTINLAQSLSLQDIWKNLHFESFPPLYLLVLRIWAGMGMAGSDAGIRVLGLFIGLLFLGSLWVCRRWVAGGPPTISIALLGGLPSIMFALTSNRAYGLTLCLLTLTFGTIWRMLETPSKSRILLAAVSSLLFVHCLYYSFVFLGAMLLGAAFVALRRRRWRAMAALMGIGIVSSSSVAVYLPVIRRSLSYAPLFQPPNFGVRTLWARVNEAIAFQSSAQPPSSSGFEVWIWLALLAVAVLVGALAQFCQSSERGGAPGSLSSPAGPAQARADLALFGVITLVCGSLGQLWFLLRLHYPTQSWYYVSMFTLCAISVESVLKASWPAWRHWALVRLSFLGLMLALSWRASWEEAHTRRSNVDMIAAALEKEAGPSDLIVVYSAWEGITFDRYYRGPAQWRTIPPIESHKVHRTDLVWGTLSRTNVIASMLADATDTLRGGGAVWVVGLVRPDPSEREIPSLPQAPALPTKWWLAPYFSTWSAQLTVHLAATASRTQTLDIPMAGPVSSLENLPVFRFSGYQTGDPKHVGTLGGL